MRKSILLILLCMTLASGVIAQSEELLKPGITPDSPFYFMDVMFDGLQSPESLADEKAAEVVAMAQENKLDAMEKARERYEKAMERRNRDAQESEEDAEEVTRQASMHMEVLAEIYEKAPEEAKQGIEEAMKNSADGRQNALQKLNEFNPEKGAMVAQETLSEILQNAPEQAKAGLQRALDAIGSDSPPEQSGEAGGYPSEQKGAPEDIPPGEPEETQNAQQQGNMPPETELPEKGENFRLLVSDAPADIADFEYLIVHISKARIFSGEGSENGFEEREINASVDLTELVGNLSTEVLSTELEPATYTKIELYVDSVDAKAMNATADVMVPSEKLQIIKPFTIVEGEITTFVFDINVVKKGPGNEYNLLPVISESGVVGEDLDEDEVEEVEAEDTEEETEEECTTDSDCDEDEICVDQECEKTD